MKFKDIIKKDTTNLPSNAIKELKKAGLRLNLTEEEAYGCKLALNQMAKKNQ